MKASYRNDTVKGPGHGFLYITEIDATENLEGVRFCIKRASDQCCLGRGGWQRSEIFMEPGEFSPCEKGSALAVGPDVVDNLDPRESYRLTLRQVDGATVACPLQASEVAYSILRAGSGTGAIPEPEEERQQLAPPPETASSTRPDTAGADIPPAPEPSVPLAISTIVPEQEDVPEHRPGRNSSRLLLPGVLLLVVIIGAIGVFAAWKNLRERPTETENALPVEKSASMPTSPPTERSEPGGASSADGEQKGKGAAETDRPLTRAREHLAGSADPLLGLDIAKELRMKEDGADAAFLLAEDAAGKGNAEAMLLTGIFYDPTDDSPSGSIIKDAEQALYWYQQASGAGQEEAGKRLTALRAWLETEAGKGSAKAEDLLKRF